MTEDDELEVDDSDEDEYEVEEIGVETAKGQCTGVFIETEGQLRRRTRRWKNRIQHATSNPPLQRSHEDAVSYAVRFALRMEQAGDLYVQDVSGNYSTSGPEVPVAYQVPHELLQGWARRPKKGKMYGRRYVNEFREEIKRLFDRGEEEKSKKMGPGRMLEELRRKHPNRFDLPTENEIRQEISKLAACRKKASPQESTTIAAAQNEQKLQRAAQTKFINRLLDLNPQIMPTAALERFREEFPECHMTDGSVKSKVSNLKSQRKKQSVVV